MVRIQPLFRRARKLVLLGVLSMAPMLGGCITQNFQKGYVLPEGALEQIPIGSSQEHVLIILGHPPRATAA